MTIEELNKIYDQMQDTYGDPEYNAILNGGKINPDICFIFMNPTKRNIASSKNWQGIRSPWIGTKNIWPLFYKLNLVDKDIHEKIRSIKGNEWSPKFAKEVYDNVKKHNYYITNLGKCTQCDARPLPDKIFKNYLDLLYQEIEIINPKKIILFGNQVSSIILDQKISVSTVRKQKFNKKINNKEYTFYPVYYPVGNGSFNIDKAIEDLKWILKQ